MIDFYKNKYHTNRCFRPLAACPSLNYTHYQGILPSVKKKFKKKFKKKSSKKKFKKEIQKKRVGKTKIEKVGQN